MTPEIVPTQIKQCHVDSQFAADLAIVETAAETGSCSVDSPEQLPGSLLDPRIGSFVRPPGLLFWHQPLGGGECVPQFRPDNPTEGSPKYIFPKDSGSVISITPTMKRRLDEDGARESLILIVEGTKQALFAATYAPDDVVVVGIQGCWGWSSDGMAIAEMNELCKGRRVVVTFDADISSNQKVYDAAERLTSSLTATNAKTVKFLKVPGSKSTGLDDFLARQLVDDRAAPLATLIANADPFAKMRKPPRRSSALGLGSDTFIFVSEELGEVVEAVLEIKGDNGGVIKDHVGLTIAGVVNDGVTNRNVRRVSTMLHAAPRIVTIVEEKDYLAVRAESKLSYDVELQRGQRDSKSTIIIEDVSAGELSKVRDWLDRGGAKGGLASLEGAGVSPLGQARIAEAMRNLADTDLTVEHRTVLPHTGWVEVDGVIVWVDSGGAHGPNSKVTTIKAQLEGSVAGINIPGFSETYTRDDVVESIKATLGVCDWLHDSTPWIAGISGIFYSLTGGNPNAVLYFDGGAGSGKSSITGAMASIFSEKWGTGANPMASIEGTEAYLSDMTSQIHNCPIILDDARDRSSTRSQESQDNAIDSLIRVGYSGGGAARGKKVPGKSKDSWGQSVASSNRPFVIIAGETLPNSAPLSTIERILEVEIKMATSMKASGDTPDGESGHQHLVEISRSGALRPFVSYFLQQIAMSATRSKQETDNKVNRLDRIRVRMETIRTEVAKEVLDKHLPKGTPASPRVLEVTATFLAGASIMFGVIKEFSKELGFDEAKIRALEYEWHRKILLAAMSHTSTNLASHSDVDTIIASVQGAIASTRYCLGIPTHSETCIGEKKDIDIDGVLTPCIALIPSEVKKLPGMLSNLGHRLTSVLVRGKDAKQIRTVRINGDPVKCFVIRLSDYNKGIDDDTPPSPPPASQLTVTPTEPLADELTDDELAEELAKERSADYAEQFAERFNEDIDGDYVDLPENYSAAEDFD